MRRTAMFVESDQRAAAVIGQNIETLGVAGATVRRGAVASVLAAGADDSVDLVFADPPYDVGDAEVNEMLTALTDARLDRRAAPSWSSSAPRPGPSWPGRRAGSRGRPAATATPASSREACAETGT